MTVNRENDSKWIRLLYIEKMTVNQDDECKTSRCQRRSQILRIPRIYLIHDLDHSARTQISAQK